MEYETREPVKGHEQKSKEDWWDCMYCGKQHRGFPYECPKRREDYETDTEKE